MQHPRLAQKSRCRCSICIQGTSAGIFGGSTPVLRPLTMAQSAVEWWWSHHGPRLRCPTKFQHNNHITIVHCVLRGTSAGDVEPVTLVLKSSAVAQSAIKWKRSRHGPWDRMDGVVSRTALCLSNFKRTTRLPRGRTEVIVLSALYKGWV